MDVSIQALFNLLTKLVTLHQSLHQLAERKTDAIKRGSMEELNALMTEEQAHIAAIAKLEEARVNALNELVKGHLLTGQHPTLQDVINRADEKEQQQLTSVQTELVRCLSALKQQNDLNQQLIYQSLQFVHLTMDLVRPQAKSYNYERPNGVKQSLPHSSFNSKI
ncbi:flagellar protein FlgN [Metabacillus iocasae]|uniref:Flagellar biosynthesis/type III secretory pathway chaperone n=1 Tax=Priestia iocasae TaxID=2291674 RepID=A0ABS2QZ38_9BACI|nr:flagellar protein FlgN [Metabacillus iocasae]MBM7704463.1 flagellar biosynthesis/type III secretory pathway chaperone [Metabacillus iocasae]